MSTMSQTERDTMTRMVAEAFRNLNDTEQKIAARTKESLAEYVAVAFQEAARLLGYMLTVPVAYIQVVAESIYDGFAKGFKDGFDIVERARIARKYRP